MKEPHSESLANYADLESYAGDGDIAGEALTEALAGRLLSREISLFGCRPCGLKGKAISTVALIASGGRRIVAEVTGCAQKRAAEALVASGHNVRAAILMAKFQVDRGEAEGMLRRAGDNLWSALGTAPSGRGDSP